MEQLDAHQDDTRLRRSTFPRRRPFDLVYTAVPPAANTLSIPGIFHLAPYLACRPQRSEYFPHTWHTPLSHISFSILKISILATFDTLLFDAMSVHDRCLEFLKRYRPLRASVHTVAFIPKDLCSTVVGGRYKAQTSAGLPMHNHTDV